MISSRPYRIIIPPVVCYSIISISGMSIEYYPLSFGLIIGISNWDLHKYRPYLGTILSVFLSYLSFFIAYFSIALFGLIRDFILRNTDFVISDDTMGQIAFLVGPFIIAPLLVFLSYRFIFNIPKLSFSLFTITFTIMTLVLLNYFFIHYSNSSLNNALENEIINPYNSWQVIMALALQLLITQKQSQIKINNL